MSVIEVQQDIVEYIESLPTNTLHVVIHQANCFNSTGAGIAKVLASAYPQVATCEQGTKAGDKSKLGRYTYAYVKENVVIVNAYGQYNYGWKNPLDNTGRQTDYQALHKSLTLIRDDFFGRSAHPVVFIVPKYIGQGLAKGNSDIIQPMVKEIFKDCNLILFYN